jgi:hypothetical protein
MGGAPLLGCSVNFEVCPSSGPPTYARSGIGGIILIILLVTGRLNF